ncbi:MAG: carbohydrate kinase family protein [Methanosarcinales archaeon]|nr:carbohydrate kinase family protein [Methanosarcinales archaeon]
MDKTISVVGHTALDHLFEVTGFPQPNSSAPINDYQIYYGGGAANIAAGIARLGGSSQLISPVGGDFKGSEYCQHMENLGVDTSLMFRMEHDKTASAFIYTDEDHNQITYFYWGASKHFPELEPPHLDFVHLATADPVFNSRAAQRADFVSFDPGQDLVVYSKECLETILSHTDILFTNRHEIERLSQITGCSREELEEEIGVVVVTLDKDGSEIHTDGERIFIPAIEVDASDPTGAGDAHRAGFLLAYARGYPLEVCGRVGSTTASFVVEKVGCQTNLPTWEQVRQRFNNYYRDFEL